jgi:hypothetical protein
VSLRALKPFPGLGQVLKQAATWFRECYTAYKCFKRQSYLINPSRLLLISPGLGHISVIDTAELKRKVQYAALNRLHPVRVIYKSANRHLKGYCWGGEQVFSLTKSYINTYKASIPYNKLPQTIKDAVKVILRLRLRFLWVDSLYIVQDNNKDKLKKIRKMTDIYCDGEDQAKAQRYNEV